MASLPRLDGSKLFLLGITVLVIGLGGGILYAASQVRSSKEAVESATANFKSFLQDCTELKQNQERVSREKVDLNEPLTYVFSQIDASGIPKNIVKCNQPTRDVANIRKGYEDMKIEVTFQGEVDREQIARFLYNIEANSAILKAYSVETGRVDPDDKSNKWKNVKVHLAYRKPQVKPT